MPVWKVFAAVLLATASFGLAFATLIVPLTMTTGGDRWVWLAGLLVGTVFVGTLFALFLRRASALMR
jgi:hypothetical protein